MKIANREESWREMIQRSFARKKLLIYLGKYHTAHAVPRLWSYTLVCCVSHCIDVAADDVVDAGYRVGCVSSWCCEELGSSIVNNVLCVSFFFLVPIIDLFCCSEPCIVVFQVITSHPLNQNFSWVTWHTFFRRSSRIWGARRKVQDCRNQLVQTSHASCNTTVKIRGNNLKTWVLDDCNKGIKHSTRRKHWQRACFVPTWYELLMCLWRWLKLSHADVWGQKKRNLSCTTRIKLKTISALWIIGKDCVVRHRFAWTHRDCADLKI